MNLNKTVKDGFNHFKEIIEGEYVVVVNKNSKDLEIIGACSSNTALKEYKIKDYDIISFNGILSNKVVIE